MALLEVHNLTKNFGGLTANDNISFQVEKGDLIGIIGPNGAGKTTLFNCVAGLHPISSGQIIFDGKDITELKSHEVARLGMARTFQVYAASGDLSILENVMVGCFMRTSSTLAAKVKAKEILKEFKLENLSDYLLREIPVAAQKRVTMATAVGTQPRILLLDEVAAGLNPSEIEEIMGTIRSIHNKLAITVMLIEHVMELVMNVSDRVIVIDSGKKIAEGNPEDISNNPDVIKAYLGERYVQEHSAELR
ncbi:MAG: ABC transporter ATP-binding protein [Deltaproteobacteria bacterium]|nr:ABC transporter ATP-binding protein [Deltaproteobacteria bacterium]